MTRKQEINELILQGYTLENAIAVVDSEDKYLTEEELLKQLETEI